MLRDWFLEPASIPYRTIVLTTENVLTSLDKSASQDLALYRCSQHIDSIAKEDFSVRFPKGNSNAGSGQVGFHSICLESPEFLKHIYVKSPW